MPNTYSAWRKSSRSGGNNGNCVEIGFGETARAVRDTKEAGNPHRCTLEFTGVAFADFLDTVRFGRFDC